MSAVVVVASMVRGMVMGMVRAGPAASEQRPCAAGRASRCRLGALLGLLACLLGARAEAAPRGGVEVPAELAPWVGWALEDAGDALCPVVEGSAVCVWPGTLELVTRAGGCDFRQGLFTDRRSSVPLPGSATSWPQAVTVDGKPAVVLALAGTPSVAVEAGAHLVVGRFEWKKAPELLEVPVGTAMVALELEGRKVGFPKRTEAGAVWLRGAGSDEVEAGAEPERLELDVVRRLEDAVPFRVTTRLLLRVSGSPREVRLGRVLLAGTVPLSVQSPLPLRLEPGGELILQVRSGTHQVELVGHAARPPEALGIPKRGAPWPEREFWAWAPNARLRQVDVSGAVEVDPSRTPLPDEWRQLTAFALAGEGALRFNTQRRGEPSPLPNRVELERQLWLDLDGEGFTGRDRLSGAVHQGWRLDFTGGALGSVSLAGVPALVTLRPGTQLAGVEVRGTALELLADFRIEGGRELEAVGWSQKVEKARTTLHLPPGWELLGATGVDEVPGTWIGRWTLFDFFFLLVIALAVARLAGRGWGVAALLGLALCEYQPDAPEAPLWVLLLSATALLHVVGAGRARSVLRVVWLAAVCGMGLSVTSFAVTQIRHALFPATALGQAPPFGGTPAAVPVSEAEAPASPAGREEGSAALSKEKAEGKVARPRRLRGYGGARDEYGMVAPEALHEAASPAATAAEDPDAVIQTGRGVPSWSFRSWFLEWSGPVDSSQHLRLLLLSPNEQRLLTLLRLLLLAAVLVALVRATPRGLDPPAGAAGPSWRKRKGAAAPAVAALCSLLGALLTPRLGHAEVPSDDVLQELRRRLLAPAPCAPECVSVSRLDLELEGRELTMTAEVHAGATDSYQLPGPTTSWLPATVELDGKRSAALVATTTSFLRLRLPPGKHTVKLQGPIAGGELSLSLGSPPRLVRVDAPGWQVDGLREDGRVEGTLHLVRSPSAPPERRDRASAPEARVEDEQASAVEVPPWLLVTRTLSIGVRWRVHTEAQRMSAVGSPIAVRFPLLSGEQITSADLPTEHGSVVLSMDRSETTLGFDSVFEPRARLTLTAGKDTPWSEVWTIECASLWHCDAVGLAPIEREAGGRWLPSYRPWPGEALQLSFSRIGAARGQSVTLDDAELRFAPGRRLTSASLLVTLRSSSTATQRVTLPPGAEVQRLSVDGEARPVHREGDAFVVSLTPTSRLLALDWQQPGGLEPHYRSPVVRLGREAVSARVSVTLPHERWLLFAGGPAWGPAVLFWGFLLLVLGLALVLARLPGSPLRAWQWGLLGLGLTQVPVPAAALVPAWFFALQRRSQWASGSRLLRNLGQVALVGLTLAFCATLATAIYEGLLSRPDMQVIGNGSTDTLLQWRAERTLDSLPTVWVVSVPLLVWQVAMLLWALWLASSLLGWLRWGWQAFTAGGGWVPAPPRLPGAPRWNARARPSDAVQPAAAPGVEARGPAASAEGATAAEPGAGAAAAAVAGADAPGPVTAPVTGLVADPRASGPRGGLDAQAAPAGPTPPEDPQGVVALDRGAPVDPPKASRE